MRRALLCDVHSKYPHWALQQRHVGVHCHNISKHCNIYLQLHLLKHFLIDPQLPGPQNIIQFINDAASL